MNKLVLVSTFLFMAIATAASLTSLYKLKNMQEQNREYVRLFEQRLREEIDESDRRQLGALTSATALVDARTGNLNQRLASFRDQLDSLHALVSEGIAPISEEDASNDEVTTTKPRERFVGRRTGPIHPNGILSVRTQQPRGGDSSWMTLGDGHAIAFAQTQCLTCSHHESLAVLRVLIGG